jgi:glycerophosphoryl diester phosphodiesterase
MTLVVAHRGSSGVHAEHTLVAYEKAIDEGADALECDVRLTRDGVLVCVHDRRVDRTSNGRGKVSTLELADLHELDFASWKNRDHDPLLEASWEQVDRDGSRVLTLERLLALVTDHERPVQLHVETKHPTRYGGLVEKALVDLLARFGLAAPLSRSVSPVTVMSFSWVSLRRISQLAPTLPTLFLMQRVPERYRDGSLPARVSTAGPSLRVLRAHPRYVERVHAQGNRVHVWTVDEPEDIEYVLSLGVDAVISNHPRRVLRSLGRV